MNGSERKSGDFRGKCPPDPKFILKGEMGLIHCFNFPFTNNDTCTELYVGNEEGEVCIWNLITKKIRLKQKLGCSIQSIHFYNGSVVTQEKEGLIKIYKLENNEFKQIHPTITIKGTFCKSIIIDHSLFAPAENGIDMFNLETMEKNSLGIQTDKNFGMMMCLTEVSKDSELYILALYETGNGVLWDAASSRVVDEKMFKPQPLSGTFNKIKERGIVVGASSIIQVFEVRNVGIGGMSVIYEINVSCSASLTVVSSRTDSLVFVVGGSDGKLRYFSWKTFRLLAVLTEHSNSITDVRFVPKKIPHCSDGAMAASSVDSSISFWDLY